jgi:hypothetical protein
MTMSLSRKLSVAVFVLAVGFVMTGSPTRANAQQG